MTRNGKFFVAPQRNNENFKVLFARMAAQGVGRPVDHQGLPDGPWTPELLADAISAIDANRHGIELRTVQLWFQDNDSGIGTNNIRWLARIFGCHDPEATSRWQAELRAAKERLASERRTKRTNATNQAPVQNQPSQFSSRAEQEELISPLAANDRASEQSGRVNLALRSEAMFAGPNALNLPIALWGGLGVLWLLAYSLGIHSNTYSPSDGIHKQIGFIWSPGWNIGEALFLPMFLVIVSGLLNSWKRSDRLDLLTIGEATNVEPWQSKVCSFWLSYWAILIICFLVIFLIQWIGVYLSPLLAKDPGVPMIDWILIALVRPEVLSIDEAIVVSFLGFLYSGVIYWFMFVGLLLLYTIAGDFAEICAARQGGDTDAFSKRAFESGTRIMQKTFRCTILGILLALCIKLNAAYLVSDAASITEWLIHDASLAIGLRTDRWGWINGSPSPFFTSFLLLFLLCFVFFACLLLIKTALDRTGLEHSERRFALFLWTRMTLSIGFLAISFMFVGQIYGFSIILGLSIFVSFVSLTWRAFPVESKSPRANACEGLS